MVHMRVEQPKNPIKLDKIESIEFKDYSFRYPSSEFDSLNSISFKNNISYN